MIIKYRYRIDENTTTETFDLSKVPSGVSYEIIQEQIENEIIQVPQEVQLWRIRTILKLLNFEDDIVNALNNLEEPIKTGALYIWEYGTTIERNSQTVLLLQSILQMTEEQVDDFFIQANNIQL